MNRPLWAVRQAHEEIWFSAYHNASDWLKAIDARVDELVMAREREARGMIGLLQYSAHIGKRP